MGILIESFNQLTRDLKAKKEELLHTQRIAAWKEVAQRMAHEIKIHSHQFNCSRKNSKEIRQSKSGKKFDEVVKNGTETIIRPGSSSRASSKEFSEFARMPNPINKSN